MDNSVLKNTKKWPLKRYIEENGLALQNQSECIIHNETNISILKLISKKLLLKNFKKI